MASSAQSDGSANTSCKLAEGLESEDRLRIGAVVCGREGQTVCADCLCRPLEQADGADRSGRPVPTGVGNAKMMPVVRRLPVFRKGAVATTDLRGPTACVGCGMSG